MNKNEQKLAASINNGSSHDEEEEDVTMKIVKGDVESDEELGHGLELEIDNSDLI